MDKFESQFQPERVKRDSLEENLTKYLERYDAELTEKFGVTEYRQRLQEMEGVLLGLLIAHSMKIDLLV